jgi:hypothetical protein
LSLPFTPERNSHNKSSRKRRNITNSGYATFSSVLF